jgi:hypothetical protein
MPETENVDVNCPASSEDAKRIWINIAKKVASFHPIEDSFERSFYSDQMFVDYLDSLAKAGFKFQ